MKALGKAERSVTLFCKGAIAVLFTILILSAALQVISRFVFNSPIFWTDELCIYSMVWMGMIGSAYAVRSGSHIKVDLLPNFITPGAAKILYRALLLFVIFFSVILIWYGCDFAMGNMRQTSATLKIPMAYIYVCFPLGGLLMLYYTLLEIFGISEG